jgi:hypothetical protein
MEDYWFAIIIILALIYFIIKKFLPKKQELGEGEFGPVRKEIKDSVYKKQRGFCGHKGCSYRIILVLHHKKPKHLGGDNRVSNLVYYCPNHHAEAHMTSDGKVDYKAIPEYLIKTPERGDKIDDLFNFRKRTKY